MGFFASHLEKHLGELGEKMDFLKSHSARGAVWWRDTHWVSLPRGVVDSSPEELDMSHLTSAAF